jgi:hypothetical protein
MVHVSVQVVSSYVTPWLSNTCLISVISFVITLYNTGNGRLHEDGAVHSFFAEGAKQVHLWAVMNMFQENTWIFAAPDPAVTLPYH